MNEGEQEAGEVTITYKSTKRALVRRMMSKAKFHECQAECASTVKRARYEEGMSEAWELAANMLDAWEEVPE